MLTNTVACNFKEEEWYRFEKLKKHYHSPSQTFLIKLALNELYEKTFPSGKDGLSEEIK
jgi:hypothetical protein